MIDTHSPRERFEAAALAGCTVTGAGHIDGYDLLRARYADEVFELFLVEKGQPVAAVLMQPWDEPAGHIVKHASVEDSHRGRGLVRALYLHLIRDGMALLSDNERSPDAERLWRWLASSGEVDLSLLPAVPDEGEEGEVSIDGLSELDGLEDPSAWHYVARYAEPKADVSP